MISGVVISYPSENADVRGSVRHVWKPEPRRYNTVGEVYLSTVLPGVVKGWHIHKMMTLRYAVAFGRILLGLVDARTNSPTAGERMRVWMEDSGPRYCLVTIPPGVANGFRCAPDWSSRAVMLNVPDMVHDAEEISRVHPRNAWSDFDWGDYAVAG